MAQDVGMAIVVSFPSFLAGLILRVPSLHSLVFVHFSDLFFFFVYLCSNENRGRKVEGADAWSSMNRGWVVHKLKVTLVQLVFALLLFGEGSVVYNLVFSF